MVFGRKGVLVNLVVPGRSPDTIHPKLEQKEERPKKEAKAKVSLERAIAARGVPRERERERETH